MHFLGSIKNKDILAKVFSSKQALDVNARDSRGNTALHYAAYERNEFLVTKLIESKANLNV